MKRKKGSGTYTMSKRLRELEVWVKRHKGLPKQSVDDPEEYSLARFISSLKTKFDNDEFAKSELSRLRQIPGMADRVKKWKDGCAWSDRLPELERWAKRHQRLPKAPSGDPEEYSLAQFIFSLKRKIDNDEISKSELSRLRPCEEREGWLCMIRGLARRPN